MKRPVAVSGLLLAAGMWTAAAGSPSPSPTWRSPLIGIEMVLVPAGSFVMGSPPDEAQREVQEIQHHVTLTRPFYLGRYEVTQRQWRAVLGESPSQFVDCGDGCPVENMSGHEADEFVRRLSAIEHEAFRLPTEAEWEYACRAGSSLPFSTGEGITDSAANFDGRYAYAGSPVGEFRARTVQVGSFAPNAWGIFDMHGNVWEWTSDRHCPYGDQPVRDPAAHCTSPLRVIRGGSWIFGADSMRCALRYTHAPADRGPSLGLRVLREVRS